MAFIGGDPNQFQFPTGPIFQAPPTQFRPTPQGVPLSANQLPPLNFGNPGPQQFRAPQNFVPPGQNFNPLMGPQVPGGGGAVFGGSPGGSLMDPNLSTGDFLNSMLAMQFSTGDFISSAMGVSGTLSDSNNPGTNLSIQQLGQQFNSVFGQMQQQEGQMVEQSIKAYTEMKDGMFTDAHYEFDAAGLPKLVPGAENTQQKSQRLQYERRQSMAVEQRFASHPLNGQIQALTQFIDQATKAGQPITGLMLQLDAMQTQLGTQKAAAHLQAEGLPIRSDQSETANAAARSLMEFGRGAINDYGQMHTFNMGQLANNPITNLYFTAMADRQRRMMAAQQQMQQASQQMLGMLGGGGTGGMGGGFPIR